MSFAPDPGQEESKMDNCTLPVRLAELECQQQKVSPQAGKEQWSKCSNFSDHEKIALSIIAVLKCIHMFPAQANVPKGAQRSAEIVLRCLLVT
jgi:hypothetical protein